MHKGTKAHLPQLFQVTGPCNLNLHTIPYTKNKLVSSQGMQKPPDFDAKLRPQTKNSYGSQKVSKKTSRF